MIDNGEKIWAEVLLYAVFHEEAGKKYFDCLTDLECVYFA
jgi:hypothetical protein